MNDLTLRYQIERVATLSDTVAFEKLYYHYYRKLRRFAYTLIKDEGAAEEVTSDAFVNLWKHRFRLLEIESIDRYIYVSVRNLAIRKASQIKRRATFSIDDIDIAIISTQMSPEAILLNKETVKRMEAIIESLPSRCRIIYRLAKQDGLRYKEIAGILNLSVKTIDAQIAIAVCRITKAVKYNFQIA